MISEETLTIFSQLTDKKMAAKQAEDIFHHLNTRDAFAPHVMIGDLIDLLNNNHVGAQGVQQIDSVFSDILARDRHTGYYIHSALRTLYLDFALARSKIAGQENRNFLILGDYMNLSSVNDAIGRSTTNDMMATICGIYVDCMTRAGVVNWIYHRSMGDEVTFIIMDTSEEIVLRGLLDAEKMTREFVEALGLDRLRHKKYANQYGTGLITARVNLRAGLDHRTLKQELDALVQNTKKTRNKRSWFPFKRFGVEPNQFHNRSSEQRVDKTLYKYREYRSAAHNLGICDIKARDTINPTQSLLVGRAIAWPRDDRIEYLRTFHNDTKVMLRADIYNLGGLNTVFGHDGADHIKTHLVRILHDTILAHDPEEPRIFDCGGGIIDIVFNAINPSKINKVITSIQSSIYYQILCHSVEDYAATHNLSFSGNGQTLLAALSHPRQEQHGTGLVMATHLVESQRSLPEIIERLDKITHRTKMHNFSYIWTDDTHHVFGLLLNQVPDPVFIGRERLHGGSHYLPFTDALRHYLEEEDLPDIFERPVGQICEIFFGTDMQAVLGFKKAIRMLQEKDIPEGIILAIDSYAAMNARLIEENLPPLSVVSTQNRPSFAHNEHAGFRTMALAEKLENLPGSLTRLILQAQSCFRTLKIVQPHGHLPTPQSALILLEEIQQTHIPEREHTTSHLNAQLTESLYTLARLFDRGHAALHKNISDGLRGAMNGISLYIIQEIATLFIAEGEAFLGEKLRIYTALQVEDYPPIDECLSKIHQEIPLLIDRLHKKHLLSAQTQETRMHVIMDDLWRTLRDNIHALNS